MNINTLTNANRSRHSAIFERLLATLNLRDVFTGSPVQWTWGRLGKRLSSRRSADGVVFDIGNKVAKFIFSSDESPREEVRISKIAGDAGISPKVYAAYESRFDALALTQSMRAYGQTKNGHVNLFQSYINYPMEHRKFTRVFIIILEVLNGATLADVLSGKPGTSDIRVSETALERLVHKMHSIGIIHADMHTGNIFVDRTKGLRIIDFGRSFHTSKPLTLNNANNYLNRRKIGYLRHMNTFNGIPSHIYVRNIPRYRNKAALMNAIQKIKMSPRRNTTNARQKALNLARQNRNLNRRANVKRKAQAVVRNRGNTRKKMRLLVTKRLRKNVSLKKFVNKEKMKKVLPNFNVIDERNWQNRRVKPKSPSPTSAYMYTNNINTRLNAIHKRILQGNSSNTLQREYNKLWRTKYGN